jgi:hypothetical protein
MMKKTFSYLSIPVSLLGMAGFAAPVSAHTWSDSLGSSAGVVDFYQISCTTVDDAGARLEVSVINQSASSPLLSVQIHKDDLAVNGTDPKGGDAQFSPTIRLTAGNGAYSVTIDKAAAGQVKYSLDYHCRTSGGVHTGNDTDLTLLQNEGIQTPPPNINPNPDPGPKPEPEPEPGPGPEPEPGPGPGPEPGPGPGPASDSPHTDVMDQATESRTHFTGLVVTHGCQDDSQIWRLFPVTVVNSVFPNNEDAVAYRTDPVTGAETPVNLADHIEGAIGGLPSLSPGMIQDKSVFKKQKEVVDANGRVRGVQFSGGKVDTDAVAVLPFRVSTPKFLPGSCAKRLKVRIAVANWCERSKADPNRADIWMGKRTALFNDPAVMPTDNYWPTLVVNRNLAANPLAESCGEGFDLAVQPSSADIDRFLPVKGYWPAN